MEIYTVTVDSDGTTEWYKDSDRKILHRENGPAIKLTDVFKAYYINNKLHRENGPAIEHASGFKAYYLNGKFISKEEHQRRTKEKAPCEGLVVEIDGKKYKLSEI